MHFACGKRAVLREKVVIVAMSIRVPRTDESHIRLISLLTAQKIFAISPYTDKCSCHNSADCLLGVGSLRLRFVAKVARSARYDNAVDFFAFTFAFTIQKLLGLFVPLHCSTLNVR